MSQAAAPSQYEGRIDLRVKNNSHTIAYYSIAERAAGSRCRVLEVGCSTGYFGEAIRESGHEVWGVEISTAAAKVAAGRLDRVFTGKIEDVIKTLEGEAVKFDFITFGDVLEHLADPSRVLLDCKKLLNDHGAIIASVPNVAHAAVRVMLAEGRWDYSDLGILDRTHLRFFTKRSLVELFSGAGYAIQAVAPVRLPTSATGIPLNPDLLAQLAPHFTDDAADVFQYVVTAVAVNDDVTKSNSRFVPGVGPQVLVVMPLSNWSLGDIRFTGPLAKWVECYGGELRVRCMSDYSTQDLQWAQVVILQREASPVVLFLIEQIHRMGKRVVFDIDDLLTEVPKFLIVHEHTVAMKVYLEYALRTVDAVTVTTARLRSELLQYQPDTFQVSNCSAPIGVRARHYEDKERPVTLIIASTDTVRVDFMLPALTKLLQDAQIKVEIVAIGPPGQALLAAGIQARCVDNLPYEGFRQLVASLDNAIAVIPLDDSLFSNCKSPIKFLDCSRAGVVSVCSRVPPYSDLIENGKTGVLVDNNVDKWYEAIKALAFDAGLRRAISDAALLLCEQNYSMRHAAQAWDLVLDRVLNKPLSTVALPAPKAAPPRLRDWLRLLAQPAAYRSGFRILSREGISGLTTRITRLYH